MSITKRLNKITYQDVVAELGRPDCDFGEYIVKSLPDENDVKLILSDSDTVRYFLYTEDEISIVDFTEYVTMNNEEHADWGMVKIPRCYGDEI